jgi:hypothetical protein
MAKTLIGDVQSRIAKRARVISAMDFRAQLYKNHARTYDEQGFPLSADSYYRHAADERARIKVLAKDQKVDRDIVQALSAAIMVAIELGHRCNDPVDIPGFTLAPAILESIMVDSEDDF